MKKSLQVTALILAFTLIYSLVGCSGRKPITAEEFEIVMDDEDFSVIRSSTEIFGDDNEDYTLECRDAHNRDGSMYLWFYDCADDHKAKDKFEEIVDIQEGNFGDDSGIKITKKSSDDYEKVTYNGESDNGYYIYLVQIRLKNTVLAIKGDSKSDVNEVNAMLKKLGY